MGSAAVAFWALTTLVLLATAVLIVAINYVAHKEYTEEIDRLKRDLLAARERNGVYIALENYNELNRQLELNRQEINEKIQLIKVLEKEQADKEALCQELKISLQETKEDLVESKNTLKLAAETVQEQLEKERELTETARNILAVANVSTVDVIKLHDKLDRKRSVEEANSRLSRDFHKEYSKKGAHIQDSIENFLVRNSKYHTELKKSIDASLQKGQSDLSVLSEDVVYMVNTLTTMLQTWGRQSTEETANSQQNIQKLLQDSRSVTDSETNAIHNFLTEIFIPLLQNHQHKIQCLKTENEGFSKLVKEQANRNSEMVQNYVRAEMEAISQSKESLATKQQKIQQVLEKLDKDEKKRSEAFEKCSKEFESTLHKISTIVKDAEMRREECVLQDESIVTGIEESLRFLHQNVEQDALSTNAALEGKERRIRDLRSNAEVQQQETVDIAEGFLARVSSVANGIEECHDETETAVRKAVSNTEEAWARQYNSLEQQIRLISHNIHEIERHHQENSQMLIETIHKSAHSHERHIEEQRVSYSTFVDDYILSLEQECAYTSEWVRKMENYIKERDNDVEEVVTQLLQQDVPTGQTPQRRDYNYPKALVSTTPFRIMEKLQKINEVAQFREKLEEVNPESSDKSSSSHDALLSDSETNYGSSSPINSQSIEDISGAAEVHLSSSSLITREPHIRNNLRVSRSSEEINKENADPADYQEKAKFFKSASFSDTRASPRKALNTKN